MDRKELLTKYANLKIEAAKIENEIEFLKVEALKQVEEFIQANDGTLPRIEGLGTFRVDRPKTWTYPEVILQKSEELKQLKADAEANGDATFIEKPQLKFTKDK